MADATGNAVAAQSQMTVDPDSLISPQAIVQNAPANNAPAAPVDVESPLAPIPADLKNVITDQVLDERLSAAGLSVANPQMREKLRESLYVGMQYAALPLNDPRFLGHAAHMEMDVAGLKAEIAGFGQKAIQIQEQGEKAVGRLQKNGESIRSAAVTGVGVGLAAAVLGSLGAYLKLVKNIAGAGKRLLAAIAIGSGAGVLLGAITGKAMGSGLKKEQEGIINEGQGLQTQFQQLDQAAQALDISVKESFLNVHMQRAVNKLARQAEAEAQHLLSQTGQHHAATTHHSAGEDGPRVQAHTPVASAHEGHSAGEDGPRMSAHMPLAAAHDAGHQPAAHDSHTAAPESHHAASGAVADVSAPIGKFTAMHAPKGHEGGHSTAHAPVIEGGHSAAIQQQKEHAAVPQLG